MRKLIALLLILPLMFAMRPAAAQVVTTPAVPALTIPAITLPAIPAQRLTAGHAAALGAGMFAGAVAGSMLINGGALAAAIGAAAGLLLGHWAWDEAEAD
jgi:hypothetical protein